ncbi:MAG TPA: EAL domain-containing protein [Mycobacteriales bacterium]|nr:EAL domain-containing protein [Mycobacteriales bacterium]
MSTTRRRPATHAVVATDALGRIRSWDAGATTMFGQASADVLGRRIVEVIAAEAATVIANHAMGTTLRGESWSGSFAISQAGRAEQNATSCQVSAAPVIDDEGVLLAVVWTFVDARSERRNDNALRRLAALIDSTGDAVLSMTADGMVTSWNQGAEKLFGHTSAEILGKPVATLAPAQRAEEIEHVLDSIRRGVPRMSYDAIGMCADGSRVEIRVTVVPVLGAEGELLGMTALARDITPLRQLERTLSHRDSHDELTGLPNRRAVENRLESALADAKDTAGEEVAVLFVDVDRFATVNDAWGHAAGDVLLAEIAERLRRAVRGVDLVGRFGGDEFVLVCEHMTGEIAERVAARVHQLVSEPLLLNGHRITCTVSVGVALSPSYDAETLLRDAAAAVAAAKGKGRNCTRVYDAELARRAKTRLEFAAQLREALADDKLELRYQPVFDVKTGVVLGVEALTRWTHPEQGNVAPSEFLRLAEETGLMTELDSWVLRRACVEGARLLKAGVLPATAFIAVNMAERSIADPQLSTRVTDALMAAKLPASNLVLEVTETGMLADPEVVAETMRKLRLRGVGIALDDFGTGYASLAHLRQFPLTALKVDRMFVEAMREGGDELTIVASIIDLARALGVTTIAEGVETNGQLEMLRRLGCPAAQGFLWSEAVSPADLTRLLMRPDGEPGRVLAPREDETPGPRVVALDDGEVTAEHGLLRLLQLHQEGQSATTIAAALNAAGFKTPVGQRWHQRTVTRAIARLAIPTA